MCVLCGVCAVLKCIVIVAVYSGYYDIWREVI